MLKKVTAILAFLMLFSIVVNAQWTSEGAWPDTTQGSVHGIVVDPDGKVWTAAYYQRFPFGEDSVLTSAIEVFNADGTEADFSPIYTVETDNGFTVDTLAGNCRGLTRDNEGNILYVSSSPTMIFKINYQDGTGMARAEIGDLLGTSPTKPAVTDDGTIFVGPVVGGSNPIITLDSDLNFVENAVPDPIGISRTMEVTPDGNRIYWPSFTTFNIYIYERASVWDPFALTDSIFTGISCEAMAWNDDTGNLWVSSDSRGTYSHMTFFAVDTATHTMVDSFSLPINDISDEFPRGIDFTDDGQTAYVGSFAGADFKIVKFTKGAASTVDLTLNVNMAWQIQEGNFDPAADVVRAAGAFQGWSPADAPDMTDDDGDSIYTVTYTGIDPNTTYEYKFLIGTNWDNAESNNRSVDVGSSNLNVPVVWYNDQEPVSGEAKDITVAYTCNMELEILAGRFNPATDTLQVRGEFFGWGDEAPMMTQNAINPDLYEYTATQSLRVGEDIPGYKFYYTPATWEGGDNRTHTVTQDEFDAGFIEISRGFNDNSLDNVVNQEFTIKFVCNTAGAISSANNQAFTTVNTVHVTGAVAPLQWPDGGWPSDQIDRMIPLYDDGTHGDETADDGIFTTEVTFPAYTPLTVQYKYGINYGDEDNNQGGNDNENGVGADHFIELQTDLVSATVVNTFGEMGTHDLIDVVTGIEEVEGAVPSAYTLEQNYPNPFNPSTMIRFSVPQTQNVVLKVYNMLGQEVTTLLNETKSAGTYEVSFDASQLSTGIYVYTIQAGSFTSSKKMMLVK